LKINDVIKLPAIGKSICLKRAVFNKFFENVEDVHFIILNFDEDMNPHQGLYIKFKIIMPTIPKISFPFHGKNVIQQKQIKINNEKTYQINPNTKNDIIRNRRTH